MMRKLLVKIFIKNYQDYENPKVRSAYGILSGIVGIVSNLLLSGFKIITGILIGSIALTADGINNLSDAATSIITLIGFKMSSMPADKNHPYGHQRLEYVTGLIISTIILVVGGALFKSSIEKIIKPTDLSVDNFTLLMLAVAIIIKLWQSLFYRANGKLINSKTLLTSSADSRNDCLQTGAVLISCLVFRYFGLNIDGYIGLLVSIMIIVNGVQMLKEMISPLIGEAPEPEFVEKVEKEILAYPGILGIHDLVIHSYGPGKTFITVHAEVDSEVNVNMSHELIDKIEKDFMEKYNIDLVIHLDPIDITNKETLRFKELTERILKEIDERLDFHDFRIAYEGEQIKIIFDVVIPYEFRLQSKELKAEISKRLKEHDSRLQPVITVDLNYS